MKTDYKITRGNNGRYSTVYIGGSGVIETVFFGNDGSERYIGRYIPPTLAEVAAMHVAGDH